MFTGITWEEFWGTITLFILSYSNTVLCWLYLDCLRVHFKPRLFSTNQTLEKREYDHLITKEFPEKVNKLIVDLKQGIAHSFNKVYNREQSLKNRAKNLANDASLRESTFRGQIDQTIINQCKRYGSVGFRNAELKGLWNAKTLHAVP